MTSQKGLTDMALKEREGCPLRLVCPKVSFGAFS